MYDVPVAVKDALRSGAYRKNYRFLVLNDDGTTDFTIDNDNLVSESVSIDESMCSGDTLKFGLCEGASLEFQYFDHPNITGRRIQSFIDVDFKDKVKEWGEYKTLTSSNPEFIVTEPGDYRLRIPAHTTCLVMMRHNYGTTYEQVSNFDYAVTIELSSWKKNDIVYVTGSNFNITVEYYSYFNQHTIPMGYFTIKKCSRQASTGIQKVTAYNKLQSEYLDADISTIEIPSDYTDDKIAIYGLRKMLLSDYAIDVYNAQESTIYVGSQGGIGVMYGIDSISFKLTGDSNTWHPGFYSVGNTWATISNLSNVYIEIGALDEFELLLDSMASDLRNYILTSGEIVNPDPLWESIKGELYHIAGVRVYFTAPTPGDASWIIYTSKTLYEWAVAAGHDDVRVLSDVNNLYDATDIVFQTPSRFDAYRQSGSSAYDEILYMPTLPAGFDLGDMLDDKVYQINYSDMDDEDLIRIPTTGLQNVSLRQILSSGYELNCKFGQMDRVTDLFHAAELNNAGLYPAATLYPSDSLYPVGSSETSFRSWYSKLWTDTVGEQSFRKLIITYKGLDENNVPMDFTLEKTVNASGTTDYYMSDNWLLKNQIWTQQEVQDLADAMAAKMQNIRWFPFEMWAAGLPYVETGDMIEIIVGDETHTSYVLQRQLSGIQNLQDTYINGTLDVF